MGNLYERINGLCTSKGITGARMCSDVGISKGLLTDLKKGRRTGVSAVTAQKIASYFNVSVGYLLGEEEKEKPTILEDDGLTENQRNLIEFVRYVPDESAEMILKVIRSIVEVD